VYARKFVNRVIGQDVIQQLIGVGAQLEEVLVVLPLYDERLHNVPPDVHALP
jgi:hypothetical protein